MKSTAAPQDESQNKGSKNNASKKKGSKENASQKNSAQKNMVMDKEQITIDYLKVHPEFFNQHGALMADLTIPHSSGSAISLIERQVDILRQQNKQQKAQLAELIDIARDNERSNLKIHKLTLSLLDCQEIDACEVALDEILGTDFSVDALALKLFSEPQDEQPEHLFVSSGTTLALELEKLLNLRKPVCGYFKSLPMADLFEDKAESVASLAVLPLFVEKNNCFGALVLGSNNVRRFNADMGTVFLERLAETLSHVLYRFIK